MLYETVDLIPSSALTVYTSFASLQSPVRRLTLIRMKMAKSVNSAIIVKILGPISINSLA